MDSGIQAKRPTVIGLRASGVRKNYGGGGGGGSPSSTAGAVSPGLGLATLGSPGSAVEFQAR